MNSDHDISGSVAHISSPPPSALSPLQQVMRETAAEYYTSMPCETAAEKLAMYHILNGEHRDYRSAVNTTIDLVGYAIKPSKPSLSSDGEIVYYPIEILILSDGSCIVGGSKGVSICLRMFDDIRGPAPWTPPIKCICKSKGLEPPKVWNWLHVTDIGTSVKPIKKS